MYIYIKSLEKTVSLNSPLQHQLSLQTPPTPPSEGRIITSPRFLFSLENKINSILSTPACPDLEKLPPLCRLRTPVQSKHRAGKMAECAKTPQDSVSIVSIVGSSGNSSSFQSILAASCPAVWTL